MRHPKSNLLVAGYMIMLILGLLLSSCMPEQSPEIKPDADSARQPTEAAQVQPDALKSSASNGRTVVSDEEVTSPRTLRGGDYRTSSDADGVTLHPYLRTDGYSWNYIYNIYACCLLRRDPNTLELVPDMAESYTVAEDGLTFTFKLRKNIQWSDGTPMTAQDFKWTFDQAIKPENENPVLTEMQFIKSYEALDDYTIQARIDRIFAPALENISNLVTPLPKHIWEGLDWKDPEKNPNINNPTVVSGRFKLVEWKRDQHFILEANDKYWYHGAPNFDRDITEVIPQVDVSFERLKNGELDNAPIFENLLAEARTLDMINLHEWWPVESGFMYIGMNLRQGKATSNLHVRRGINYAINKELIIEELLAGMGRRLCSTFPATSWVYEPNVECYDYNAEKAVAEFEQAGYTFDGEKMVDKEGNQLTLSLHLGWVNDPVFGPLTVAVQDDLAKIGVKLEIKELEWATFLENLNASDPPWDLFFVGFGSGIEPDNMKLLWQSDSSFNAGPYQNPVVDKLWEEAAATYDNEVRKAKYQEIQRILADDAPFVFLHFYKAWTGMSKRIGGVEPKAIGIGWNRADWFVRK